MGEIFFNEVLNIVKAEKIRLPIDARFLNDKEGLHTFCYRTFSHMTFSQTFHVQFNKTRFSPFISKDLTDTNA